MFFMYRTNVEIIRDILRVTDEERSQYYILKNANLNTTWFEVYTKLLMDESIKLDSISRGHSGKKRSNIFIYVDCLYVAKFGSIEWTIRSKTGTNNSWGGKHFDFLKEYNFLEEDDGIYRPSKKSWAFLDAFQRLKKVFEPSGALLESTINIIELYKRTEKGSLFVDAYGKIEKVMITDDYINSQ